MGKNNASGVNIVFCTSVNIQLIIAGIMFLLSESIGLVLLFNYLVIPDGRMTAAFWVFQFSVVTMLINIISIPYNAMIIAYERMRAFAYIDIFNTLLKLIAVISLKYVGGDKLIVYGLLLMTIQLLTRYIYTRYCYRNFKTARYRRIWDKNVVKQMLGFSFWTVFSSSASMLMTQGMSILFNIYYGVVANAAMGIGNQVMMAVRKLTGNLAVSFAPQIVKRYASGEYEKVALIWVIGTKCSVWLYAFFSVPLILNADYVLKLWLVNVPEYASGFMRLLLLENLLRCFTGNASTIVRATGKIKAYELAMNCIRVCSFGALVICFITSNNIYFPLCAYLVNTLIQVVYNAYIASKKIQYDVVKYYLNNIFLVLFALTSGILLSKWLSFSCETLIDLIVNFTVAITIVSSSFFVIGFLPSERKYLFGVIRNVLKNKKK